MSKLLMGIDPGLSGAISVYNVETHDLCVYDMPVVEIKGRRQIDLYNVHYLVDIFAKHVGLAVIEDVGAMVYTDKSGNIRGQGASSSFAFGRSAGAIQGIVASSMIPIYLVRPSVWKGLMGLSSDKGLSLKKAIEIFPQSAQHFKRKKDADRAEAALLAYFGLRFRCNA